VGGARCAGRTRRGLAALDQTGLDEQLLGLTDRVQAGHVLVPLQIRDPRQLGSDGGLTGADPGLRSAAVSRYRAMTSEYQDTRGCLGVSCPLVDIIYLIGRSGLDAAVLERSCDVMSPPTPGGGHKTVRSGCRAVSVEKGHGYPAAGGDLVSALASPPTNIGQVDVLARRSC
jgi:hypothetical protein